MDETRYKEILRKALPDAVIVTSADGSIRHWSQDAELIFGFSAEEACGRDLAQLTVPTDSLEEEARRRVAARAGETVAYEAIRLRKDGSPFYASIATRRVPEEAEEIYLTRVADIHHDLCARKQFEESLRQASQKKSEFLTSMSHELRTPLNGVIGFTELLIDEKPGPLNERQKDYLNDVHQSAQHLLQLINDVLDLAKIEAGKIEFNPQSFPVSRAVDEVCAVVQGIARKKRVLLTAKVSGEMGAVQLDPQKFKQICYNLLSNAVKFTDSMGRVEMTVTALGSDEFELRVTDTGIGIRKEDLPRLFREFEQLEVGTARQQEGTGLGLALTKKLVELQGGQISVESRYGTGSTFMVRLPRVGACQRN